MASPQFFNYPGTETIAEQYHYSQAVKLGSIVRTSGQGGWDKEGNIAVDIEKQIETAFGNVLQALQAADSRIKFRHVYAIRSYHVDMESSFDVMTALFKELFPNHRPVWTCIQIGKLGLEGMQVEIEAEAQIPT
ncbi:hypothetical protein PCL_01559 [Purpureocillium lilacinum]|uniref:Uncharacterized protein n=1 Tax=Purpureocillium lilacinum TaxID=33203 RepID=A0A2U3E3X7_PURLI|nr:hypothetical protein PCL_01559 [Purpureocillium lilacinum]